MSDLISRADAIEAVRYLIYDRQEKGAKPFKWWFIKQRLNAIPSAELPKGELISRADAIDALSRSSIYAWSTEQDLVAHSWAIRILQSLPSTEAEWIPFKKRPLTDEEKQEYPDWTYIFDCPLPDDEEEILLSNGKYVWTDTFINDGECYLDGGDDIDDGMAWMPLPTPYKGGDTE